MSAWWRSFDSSDFTPRAACGPGWTPALQWSHVAADLATAAAYFALPAVLLVLWRRGRGTTAGGRVVVLFACFILACGIGHVLEAAMFWYPAYRLTAAWKWVTAAVSLLTAAVYARAMPRLLRFRPAGEYERLLAERDAALGRLEAWRAEDRKLVVALKAEVDAARRTVAAKERQDGACRLTAGLRDQLREIRDLLQAHAARAVGAEGVDAR